MQHAYSSVDVEEFLSDAELYPLEFRREDNHVLFARLTKEKFSQVASHDQYALSGSDCLHALPLNLVQEAFSGLALRVPKPITISHSSFARSTLASRALGETACFHCVREPLALHLLESAKIAYKNANRLADWEATLELAVSLIGRSFVVGRPTVLKFEMSPLIFDLQSIGCDFRLFLFSSMELFLLSILRIPDLKKWAYKRLLMWFSYPGELAWLDEYRYIALERLSASQVSALLWHINILAYTHYAQRAIPITPCMPSDLVTAKPEVAISSISKICGVPLADNQVRKVILGGVFGKDAKYQDRKFIMTDYQKRVDGQRKKYETEINSAFLFENSLPRSDELAAFLADNTVNNHDIR